MDCLNYIATNAAREKQCIKIPGRSSNRFYLLATKLISFEKQIEKEEDRDREGIHPEIHSSNA